MPDLTIETDYTQKFATYSVKKFENFEYKGAPNEISLYKKPMQT